MLRHLVLSMFIWVLLGSALVAFDVEATIKKVDVDKRMLFFAAGKMDRSAKIATDARFVDADGKPLAEGLKAAAFKEGARATLSIERVDGKPVVTAIKLGKQAAKTGQFVAKKVDTSGLVPLIDMTDKQYKGFKGGLYPDGKNDRPASHEAAGLALAKQVQARDAQGKLSKDGKIVLLGIGFSNTVQGFSGFMQVAKEDKEINPAVVLVNGAVGGMSAAMVEKPNEGRGAKYWATVDEKLKSAETTREQVQVIWIKETNPQPHEGGFPKYAQDLQGQIGNIVHILHDRFPNLKLVYLSSRTYGGWAKWRPNGAAPGNSEPYSYETGFAVKWLIEQQLKGDPALNFDAKKGPVKAPWLSWGPYLWANGSAKRSDGFSFALSDYRPDDQMHHAQAGVVKVGRQLVQFFKTDSTTKEWFVRGTSPSPPAPLPRGGEGSLRGTSPSPPAPLPRGGEGSLRGTSPSPPAPLPRGGEGSLRGTSPSPPAPLPRGGEGSLRGTSPSPPAPLPRGGEGSRNWPHWRGPTANGAAPDADPPITWDAKTNIKWKAELSGRGSATPIVWGDQVFIVTAIPTDRIAAAEDLPRVDPALEVKTKAPNNYYQFVVMAFDRNTGKLRWKKVAAEKVPHEGHHSSHTYAAGSPTTDGRFLYVSFGSFGIFCYDLAGSLQWQRDLGRMHSRLGWGEAVTPVIYGEALLLNWDQERDSALICLDARTGKTKWRTERDEKTSWNTPLVVAHKGRTQVIVNGTKRARSYDLQTGAEIWQCGGMTVNAIPSPVAADGIAYCMSGYTGAGAVAVPLDSTGDLGANGKVRWRIGKGTPYVPSPLLAKGRLYFTAGNTELFTILDIKTGHTIVDRERLPDVKSFYASPIAAAGRIYLVDRSGTTIVLRQGDRVDVLAINRLDDPIDASPVAVGRQLFLRGEKYLYCIEAK